MMIKLFILVISLSQDLAQGLGKYRQINEDLGTFQGQERIENIKQERFLRGSSDTNSDSRYLVTTYTL